MNKSLQLLLVLWLGSTMSQAQTTTHTINLGASYAQAEFYDLEMDATQHLAHDAWDIAFAINAGGGGVLVNEGSAFSGARTKLYVVPNKTFSDVITSGDFGSELLNDEQTWKMGAANSVTANTSTDYGWGTYDNIANKVIGNGTLYGVELKDGTYKKLVLDSMVSGTYYFQHANLDGSNAQQQTISKANHSGKTLAYFSFVTNNTVTAEVAGWDWVFTRYSTLLYTTNPPTPYTVGGLLLNTGVEAVLADNVNPATVDHRNYTLHNDSLTTIGHDWKFFDFGTGWSVAPNRVYFVKTQNDDLYQIEFLSFQGSSTGQGQFAKTYLGKLIGLDQIDHQALGAIQCFPNPATDVLQVVYTLRQRVAAVDLRLTDRTGRVVYETVLPATQQGMHTTTLALPNLPAGPYALTLQTDRDQHTKKVIITP